MPHSWLLEAYNTYHEAFLAIFISPSVVMDMGNSNLDTRYKSTFTYGFTMLLSDGYHQI